MCNEQDYLPSEFEIHVHELIQGEVNQRIEETVNELQSLKKLSKQLSARTNVLNSDIRRMETEHVKALKEKENEIRHGMFDGFVPGDTCYVIGAEAKHEVCVKCNGAKKVTALIDGEQIMVNCPQCKGYGRITRWRYFPEKDKIRTITYEVNKDNVWLGFYLERRDTKMDKIYRDQDECQKACEERERG